jgi:predicted amidohydrolase YtcJ
VRVLACRAVAVLAKKIYTSFKPLKVVEAVVLHCGKVVFAGEREKAVRMARDLSGEVLEYSDSTVIPGLIDSHTHIESLGLALNSIDLRNVSSIEELKELLKKRAGTGSGWVFGRGWDQEKFREGRFPTRRDIDEVLGDRPAILVRVCGHMALLSTAATRELRVEELAGERALRDESGEFTGLVVEEGVEVAMRQFWSRVGDEELKRYLVSAVEHSLRYGITTVGLAGTSLRTLSALAALSSGKALKSKIRAYLNLEAFTKFSELGVRAPMDFGKVRVVGVKLFADGSLGARTAYLSEPYEDLPGTKGVKLLDSSRIAEVVSTAENLGYQVAVHAIGDAALDEVLEGYRGARGRHRIEHLSVVRDDQLSRLREAGVVGVVQPHFILSDWWVVRRVGVRRSSWVYRFKTLSKFVPISLSTDTPVEPIDPWENIYAAVTRGEFEGVELARYTENEKLTVAEALHYYTYGSAYALREEESLGRLEPGYQADMVVLADDPLTLPVEDLRKVRVVEVFVDGEKVYPG